MGVLQRIGLVYLACALLARASPGWRIPAIVAVLCMASHAVLLHLPPPGEAASLGRGAGMAGWLDRAILPGRLYPPGFDPEGVLSTLGAVASGLIGVAWMRWRRTSRTPTRILVGVIAAVTLILVALMIAWVGTLPVNKPLWTPSFVLLTAGLGLALWSGIAWVWPMMGDRAAGRGLVFAGRTALTLYLVHSVLIGLLVIDYGLGEPMWLILPRRLAAPGLSPANAALVLALIGTAISLGITAGLARRGWVLRL